MKIISFSVQNYRSIVKTNKIEIKDKAILIGKNNEGKSNLLKSLVVSMNMILNNSRSKPRIISSRLRHYDENTFFWERDFPLQLRENRIKVTTFKLVFQLSEQDIIDFKSKVNSTVNGIIALNIVIGEDNVPRFKIQKGGRYGAAFNEKVNAITSFIAGKINVNYIPAIRTDDDTMNIIRNMLSDQLSTIEDDEDYISAIKIIKEKQESVLNQISIDIKLSLNEFLPDIKKVDIVMSDDDRMVSLRRNVQLVIDDGIPTELAFKGDGIKSLVALSLLKNRKHDTRDSIIVIEEPETHLHSGAIQNLNMTIEQLSIDQQIIISTHSPLFVDRVNLEKNIIIDSGKAYQTKNIKQIRDILGVKYSDNLSNARYVLIVEGEDDKISLMALLPILSIKIKEALKSGSLFIEEMMGASNLLYKIQTLKNYVFSYHVLLDNDEAGNEAKDKAVNENMLSTKNFTMTIVNGSPKAEFEDCIEQNVYKDILMSKYGIDISRGFSGKKKWADRMKNCCFANGKPWDDKLEKQIKLTVAEAVKNDPKSALNEHKRSFIDALVVSIEEMLK